MPHHTRTPHGDTSTAWASDARPPGAYRGEPIGRPTSGTGPIPTAARHPARIVGRAAVPGGYPTRVIGRATVVTARTALTGGRHTTGTHPSLPATDRPVSAPRGRHRGPEDPRTGTLVVDRPPTVDGPVTGVVTPPAGTADPRDTSTGDARLSDTGVDLGVALDSDDVERGALGEGAEGSASAWQVFRRFWPLMRPQRGLLVTTVLLLLVATICEMAGVALFGVITDEVLTAGSLDGFWVLAGLWLAAAVTGGCAHFVGTWISTLAGERFILALRAQVFGHALRLPPATLDSQPVGDLVARLTDDVEDVEEIVGSGPVQVVSSLVSVVAFAGAALVLRWELALVVFASAPLLWGLARRFTSRLRSVAQAERESNGAVTVAVEEGLAHAALMQAYRQEPHAERRLGAAATRWLRARVVEARWSAAYGPIVEVVETLCVLAIVGIGAWEIASGRLTLGGLMSFAGFIGYLYPPVQSLGQVALGVASARAAADRVTWLLDTPVGAVDRPGTAPARPGAGVVEFRRVGYRYPGTARSALTDVSFTAPAGRLTVVVGASGAGKSTLTGLLLRFADPVAGAVCLDGVDLREVTLDSLRDRVTLLLQETLILHGTVRENIAFGRPGATDTQIVQAAIAADADEFIRALPNGYDTVIGARGRLLSGGQRQRLAIARALIRNTPVLVLDEPTTGLDPAGAARITGPLRRLMAGRTTILITHDMRLTTTADHVVVLANGRVAGAGTHAELLAGNEAYRALHGVAGDAEPALLV